MSLMNTLAGVDGEVFEAIGKELGRQRSKLELIASEKMMFGDI